MSVNRWLTKTITIQRLSTRSKTIPDIPSFDIILSQIAGSLYRKPWRGLRTQCNIFYDSPGRMKFLAHCDTSMTPISC